MFKTHAAGKASSPGLFSIWRRGDTTIIEAVRALLWIVIWGLLATYLLLWKLDPVVKAKSYKLDSVGLLLIALCFLLPAVCRLAYALSLFYLYFSNSSRSSSFPMAFATRRINRRLDFVSWCSIPNSSFPSLNALIDVVMASSGLPSSQAFTA